MPTSNTRMMLFAALVLVAWCPPSTGHSAALPSTITSHTTTSTDDSLPSSGTTLNVQAMLDDAAANNRSEAVFNATRLTFGGTLTVTLPNTAAAWTTRNIPLRVVIQDGASDASAPWPTTFIKVTGVLALGSNITVQGGSYDFATQFVNLPFGLTIQDGSTLAIEGGTFRAHYPTSGTDTSLIKCSVFSLTLANAGTLSVSNYDMTVASVTASGTWYWATLHVSNVAVAISGNSRLSISNAKVHVSDVTLGNTFWMMSLYASSAAITVSDGSSLSIESNEATIANIDVGTLYIFEMHANNHPVTVHTNSLISLSHSATTVTNVKTKGYWCWNVYYPASSSGGTTIHTNSSIIITNSTNVATTVSVGDIWYWVSMNVHVSPLTVTTNSSLDITNNVIKASNVQSVNHLWWYALRVYSRSIDVITNSAINIANIHMEIANVNVRSSWYWIAMYMDNSPNSPASIRTSSNITISNVRMVAANVIVGTDMNMFMLYTKAIRTSIASSSTIAISNNSMEVTNVNTRTGTFWHPLYNTNSAYSISSGGTVAIYNNTLAATVVVGSLTANDVRMLGNEVSTLGESTTGTTCNLSNTCSRASSSVYTCSGDGSSLTRLVFGCTETQPTTTTTYAPTTPYVPASYTSSPSDRSESGSMVAPEAIFGIVFGGIAAGVGLVVVVIVLCIVCNRKNAPPANEGNNGGGTRVEMQTYTPNIPQQHNSIYHTAAPQHQQPDYNSQPVLGVPIETPVESLAPNPYGGGGCYM